jgi:Type II secretion system (T2SS), protein E, N-terminal domain
LEAALAEQSQTGAKLGDTLVRLGFVTGLELSEALAAQGGFQLIPEEEVVFDPAFEYFGAIPELRRMRAIPIRIVEDRVLLAIDRVPSNADLTELCRILGAEVVAEISSSHVIDTAFETAAELHRTFATHG